MFDEDFSSICGEFADLDGDGIVDMEEYLNEEDDYNRIMGNHDDEDEDYSFDDEDEDEDYSFDEEDEDEDFDSDNDDTDNSEIEFPITFVANHSNNNTNENRQKSNKTNIEQQYYDRSGYIEYRIGDAIYDHFPVVRQNFNKRETRNFYDVVDKVYRSDKKSGLKILIWLTDNFPNVMHTDDFRTQNIICHMIERDNETENDFILKYIYENPNFEKIVLGEQYAEMEIGIYWYTDDYVPYLVGKRATQRVISTYYTVLKNPYINKKEYPKEKQIEDILYDLKSSEWYNIDRKLYDFFKSEIESVGKPIKIDYLMELLNFEEFGRSVFCKTYDGVTKNIYDEDDELETNENLTQSDDSAEDDENEENSEECEAPFWLEQRISDLEEKLNESNKRIALLEQLLGINDQCDPIEKRAPKKPSTTPEDENDFFEHSLNVMGVQYADEYAVKNVSIGDTVMFLPDPENEYDKNAVLVLDIRGYKLGYIPRWANKQLLKDIESTGAYGIVSRVGQDKKYIEIDVWIKTAE